MGRIIKFRVWNEEAKVVEVIEGIYCRMYCLEDMPLMQFTGLYDKNGKEIYEGDIVKDRDYITGIVTFGEWNNNGCIHDGEYAEGYGWYIDPIKYKIEPYSESNGKCSLFDGYEIVGNIYENPELIP